MAAHSYLCPSGLLYGDDAEAALAAGIAGRLGGGAAAFSACVTVGGADDGRAADYREVRRAAEGDARVRAQLEQIERPRPSTLDGEDRPLIMGVINVTPDSFSDGGQFSGPQAAIAHGVALKEAGADILDVGGESTRPGAEPVALTEELDRVLPVIDGLVAAGALVSIDTRKAAVMRAAVARGAGMINDITALTYDPESPAAAAQSNLPVVLMHAAGDPRTMQDNPTYGNVTADICRYLEERIASCTAAGIARERLIADPGIGFGKTVAHNLELVRRFATFHTLGVRLLIGVSRKGFIGATTGEKDARARVPGSIVAGLAAVAQGAVILRVHDVRETAQALALWQALWVPQEEHLPHRKSYAV